MRTLATKLLGATLLTAAAATAANAQLRNGDMLDENASIVENASRISNFTTLVSAVDAAGLAEDLMGEGPYTVFAPTNAAFGALPEGTVEELLMPENREQLDAILSAHVVPGRYSAGDMDLAITSGEFQGPDTDASVMDGVISFDTISLTELNVNKEGDTFYVTDEMTSDGNAAVIAADIPAGNGVIHAIDGVILPNS